MIKSKINDFSYTLKIFFEKKYKNISYKYCKILYNYKFKIKINKCKNIIFSYINKNFIIKKTFEIYVKLILMYLFLFN